MENSRLVFHPIIYIRAERVAEVLNIGIDKANSVLADPETKMIIQTALDQAFQETIDTVIRAALRVTAEHFPARVDCAVSVQPLSFSPGMGA